MKTRPIALSIGITLAISLGIAERTFAQVNTAKVLREASGKYKGTRSGGTAVFATNGVTNSVVTPPTLAGSFRFRVSSRKPTVRLASPQLPGSGNATYSGKRKRAAVKRQGKRIVYLATGTGQEDDGFSAYRNGRTRGSLSRKGKSWKTDLKMSASQDQGGGNTKTVSGIKIKAKK